MGTLKSGTRLPDAENRLEDRSSSAILNPPRLLGRKAIFASEEL
jgi:hypothetical protein